MAATEALWDAGMVVVAAAGNLGRNGHFTIKSPGNSRKIITVGSLTDKGTGNDFSDDFVSTYSSRGPTAGDNVLKPDLVAPGNRVGAVIPGGRRSCATTCLHRIVACNQTGCEGDYLVLSGTSMSTPLVAATVALMLEKDPSASPATIKARLMRTARKLDVDPTIGGAGVLDIDAALDDASVVARARPSRP